MSKHEQGSCIYEKKTETLTRRFRLAVALRNEMTHRAAVLVVVTEAGSFASAAILVVIKCHGCDL